jgi:hypothetical protein
MSQPDERAFTTKRNRGRENSLYRKGDITARWEQGEDLSMVDFRCTEYSADKVIADQEIRKKIIKIGIRRIAQEIKLDRKTVRLIAKGGRVKAKTLADVVPILSSVSN